MASFDLISSKNTYCVQSRLEFSTETTFAKCSRRYSNAECVLATSGVEPLLHFVVLLCWSCTHFKVVKYFFLAKLVKMRGRMVVPFKNVHYFAMIWPDLCSFRLVRPYKLECLFNKTTKTRQLDLVYWRTLQC